jgi:hypothetical protein
MQQALMGFGVPCDTLDPKCEKKVPLRSVTVRRVVFVGPLYTTSPSPYGSITYACRCSVSLGTPITIKRFKIVKDPCCEK